MAAAVVVVVEEVEGLRKLAIEEQVSIWTRALFAGDSWEELQRCLDDDDDATGEYAAPGRCVGSSA